MYYHRFFIKFQYIYPYLYTMETTTAPKAGFAIKNYHDVDAVYQKLNHLVNIPPLPLPREEMQAYLEILDKKM